MYQKKKIALAVEHACMIIGHLYHERKKLERLAMAGKLDAYLPNGQ